MFKKKKKSLIILDDLTVFDDIELVEFYPTEIEINKITIIVKEGRVKLGLMEVTLIFENKANLPKDSIQYHLVNNLYKIESSTVVIIDNIEFKEKQVGNWLIRNLPNILTYKYGFLPRLIAIQTDDEFGQKLFRKNGFKQQEYCFYKVLE